VVLATSLALGGCGPEPPGAGAPVSRRTRLITEPPTDTLSSERWTDDEPVFRWTFRSDADLAPWQPLDVDGRFEIDGDGFVLEAAGSDPKLIRAVEIDAARVHALRVDMGPVQPSGGNNLAELFWAGPGVPFAAANGVTAEHPNDGEHTYVFPVGRNPGWTGAIGRLRFDPTGAPDHAMRVREIVGMRRRVDSAALAALANRPLRVTLANEVRSAFVVPPGDALVWAVRVPPRGRLAFGHAMWRELAAPTTATTASTLAVTVTPDGGEPVRVFSEGLAATGERARWQEHDVDLSAYAGQQVRIAIQEHAPGDVDPLRGLLLVATPEIIAAAPDDAPINVLLVSIDTLRADHVSLYGYPRPTTPALDAWAAKSGVVFENAFAQAPWTLPSHVSMLTGLDPLQHGVNYELPIPAELPLLAERLRDAGYATAAITGGVYLHPRWGFDRGFDRYYYWHADGGPSQTREFDDGAERARVYLRQHAGDPFFLFLHTYAVHSPYWHRPEYLAQIDGPPLPEPPRNVNLHPIGKAESRAFVHVHEPRWHGPNAPGQPRLVAGELPAMVRLYDAGIRYADERLGAVLAELDALGLAERTLVIVTSDHGEMMGEHGEFSHASLRDPVMRVPLVIGLPSRFPGGRRVAAQVRSIDIAPTVMATLGLPPLADIQGVSLLPWLTGTGETPPALEAWAYAPHPNLGAALRVDNRLKYLFNDAALAPLAGKETLYRLDRDAAEAHDVAASEGETAALRTRMRAHLAARPGLRATIANAAATPLRLALEGRAVGPTRVKALDADCRCVEWRAGAAAVTLAPQSGVTLRFDDVVPGELTVRALGDAGAPAEVALRLDPTASPGPWGAEKAAAGWTSLDAPDRAPDTGIRVWWEGTARHAPTIEPADPELVRQLRTLGYVE